MVAAKLAGAKTGGAKSGADKSGGDKPGAAKIANEMANSVSFMLSQLFLYNVVLPVKKPRTGTVWYSPAIWAVRHSGTSSDGTLA